MLFLYISVTERVKEKSTLRNITCIDRLDSHNSNAIFSTNLEYFPLFTIEEIQNTTYSKRFNYIDDYPKSHLMYHKFS